MTSTLFGREYAAITVASLSTVALAAFDGIAVIAVLPRITADLGDVGAITWVITGFLLSSTIAVVAAGPVVDALGVRRTFRATLVIFGSASVACALAPNVPVLVAFRIVQGIGGGLVLAVALAAVGLVYPAPLVPRAYAAISALWGVMAVLGPAVAAGLSAVGGWQAVFLVNVPLCLLAAALAWNRLPSQRADAQSLRIDGRGILLLAAFTVVSVVGLSAVSGWSVAALAGAAAIGGLYWLHTARRPHAVLERRYFARMPLSATHLASAAVFGACLGLNAYLPLYVQAGLDHSGTVAAASVVFLSVGWSVGSIGVSRLLGRARPVDVAGLGFALIVPAVAVGLFVIDTNTSLAVVWTITAVQGLGIGIVSTSMLTYLQRQVDASGMGRANAAHQYERNLSYTYCAAFVGAVLLWVVQRRVGNVDAVRDLLSGDDVETGASTASAIAAGFRWAHLVALVVVTIGAATLLALRSWARNSAPVRDLVPTEGPQPYGPLAEPPAP